MDDVPLQATQKPGKSPLAGLNRRGKLLFWLCLAAVAGSCAAILYYTWGPARTSFMADCTDTLYWADAALRGGGLLNPDFYYATLQPFGGQLLMLPFVALLGFGLRAHLLGMLVFALLFFAAAWFFCTAFRLSRTRRLVLAGTLLLVLCGSVKLRELMWEHIIYYSLGILFAMLLMGLCFRVQGGLASRAAPFPKWKLGLLLGLLFVLCVGIGTDGAQVLLLCTLPLALALLAERFFDFTPKTPRRKNLVALLLVGVLLVGTLVGLLVLRFIGAGMQTGYTSEHMVFSPTSEWGQHILLLPGFWAQLLGFYALSYQDIVSPTGMVELLRIGVALLLVLLPLLAAVGYRRIQSRKFRVLLWFHGILTAFLLLSHIVGSTANAGWRFTPVVFSSAAVSVLYLMHLWDSYPATRRLTGLLAGLLALFCAANVGSMLAQPTQNGQNQHFYALVDTLEKNGLEYGYADFWISQPVTVLSDNRVKTRYVYVTEDGVTPFRYQTDKNWYTADVPALEEYFLVLEAGQYGQFKNSPGWQTIGNLLVEILTVDNYEILVLSQNPMAGL